MIKNYLIIGLLCSFLGFSQFNPSAPWMKNINSSKENQVTIDEQVAAFNEYWSTHDRNARGSGHKPFMRWEYHWRNYANTQNYILPAEDFWQIWRTKKQSRSATNRSALMALPASNWQPVGPFTHTNTGSWSSGQGRVNIVHVDPSNANTIYLGSPAGGIWKSIDNGSNWTPLTDELPQIGVSGIAVDYSNSNVIYIATGDKDAGDTYSVGVYKSIDGGLTWNPTGTMGGSNPNSAGDLLIHPTNNQIVWCATSNGIYRTTNAGSSWTRVSVGDFSQGSIRLKPGDPSTVYAVSNSGFFRSTNTGSSFTAVTIGLPASSSRLLLDVTAANAAYVYILSANASGGFQGIYRSIDGGSNFTARNTTTNVFESDQSWYDLALAVSPTNANEIYTGCLNVWKSTNGGTSISKINNWSSPTSASYTHADIHYLGFHGNKLFAGTDGGIYVSANSGVNFTDLTAGVQISQFYKIAVSKQSAGNMVGGLQDNGGHAYSGGQWKNYYGADGMDTAINPSNPNQYYGFIQYGNSLYISSTAGNSNSGSVGSPGNMDGNWVTPLVSNSVGELFSGFNGLYKLVGSNWELQNVGGLGSGNMEEIEIDPSNDNIMYVANQNKLYKSTNKGNNFTNVYTSTSGNITFIEVHSSNSNIVYVVTAGTSGKVLKSIDGGSTFVDFSTGLPAIGKNCIVHQGRNSSNPLYVGTTLGVYYRDDSITQWEAFDTNLPNVSVTDLEINLEDAKLVAATYGRGIWQTAIPIEVPANDLKFVSIQNPGININCGAALTPQVIVKNNGLTAIDAVTVNYTIDVTPYSYLWNGSIAPSATTVIDLPAAVIARGAHVLSVTTSIANDAYSDNNNGSTEFYANDSGTVGQINTFTTTTDELIAYNEAGSGEKWVRGTRTDILTSSGNTVYTTNLSGSYSNNLKTYLVSQCYNLANVVNPQISFAMKYDTELNWDVVYVEYSTNFGASWSVLGEIGPTWYNSDRTPETSGSDCNNCPGAQWTGTNTTLNTYSYSLNALNAETNIIFRIVFHSDQAEFAAGVTIDDFVINGTLSNQNFELQNMVLYPNPSNGIFNLNAGLNKISSIDVYDVTGKIVWSKKDFEVSNAEIQLNLSAASQGIYFVKIATENQSTVKRIIIE